MHFLWALHEEISLHTIHGLAIFTEQKVIMWEKTICLPTSPPLQEDNVYKGKIPIISGLLPCSSTSRLKSLPTLVTASGGLWSTFLYVSVSSGLQRGPGVKNKRQRIMRLVSPTHGWTITGDSPAVPTPHQHSMEEDAVVVAASDRAPSLARVADKNPLLSLQLPLCKWFC